jgi:hypothetical protein
MTREEALRRIEEALANSSLLTDYERAQVALRIMEECGMLPPPAELTIFGRRDRYWEEEDV